MKKNIRICFVGNLFQTFVKNDYEILRKRFKVNVLKPPRKTKGWIRFLYELFKNTKKSDITFSWFAGWHSAFAVFFSKILKKKSIVIVGGYDAANIPELNYGAFTKLKEKIPARYVYKNVNSIIVVEPGLKDDIIKNTHIEGNNIIYIPTGHDSAFWKANSKKENNVLTVAIADNLTRLKIKGFETFVKSANILKNTKFTIVGVKGSAKQYLSKISNDNVELIESVKKEKLISYYKKAKIYCQLSIKEGLPTALCEAMLCECIPVGTNISGIKTAMGDVGFYANYGNVNQTVNAIRKALDSDEELGKKARERIIEKFSINRREKELKKKILEMTR